MRTVAYQLKQKDIIVPMFIQELKRHHILPVSVIFAAIGLLAILYGFISCDLDTLQSGKVTAFYFATTCIAIALFIPVFEFTMVWHAIRHIPELTESVELEFDASRIIFKCIKKSRSYTWSSFHSWAQDTDFMYLNHTTGKPLFVIPKNAFSRDEMNDFARTLKAIRVRL